MEKDVPQGVRIFNSRFINEAQVKYTDALRNVFLYYDYKDALFK